jgi:hypothetical protein
VPPSEEKRAEKNAGSDRHFLPAESVREGYLSENSRSSVGT